MAKKAASIITDENGNIYIHITLATGNANVQEASLMLMFNGIGFAFNNSEEGPYILLGDAINWNRAESRYCVGDKSHFHLKLAEELSDIPETDKWQMSDELLSLLAKNHPEQTKMLYKKYKNKDGEKGLSDKAKKIIESSVEVK